MKLKDVLTLQRPATKTDTKLPGLRHRGCKRLPQVCVWLTYSRKGNQDSTTVREGRARGRKSHFWMTLCPQTFFFLLFYFIMKIYSLEISPVFYLRAGPALVLKINIESCLYFGTWKLLT